MDEAFDTRFKLHECPIRNQINYCAFDLGTHRIFGLDLFPRIRQFLLQTKADPFLLPINIEDNTLDVVPDLENLGRMSDATPTHVGDMEQAVNAVQVDKRAEISNVFDRAF